ncbi:MAG: hypothetical protein GY940_00950, partial [bacterium]|nr:hypothetical protein [bacterium]
EDKKKKKKIYPTTYDDTMLVIDTSLENSEKPGEFQDSISGYGFGAERLAEGRELFTGTGTARTKQLNAIALKMEQTREIDRLKKVAGKIYEYNRLIGQQEFKDDPHMLQKLGLENPWMGPFGTKYSMSMRLYDNTDTPGVLEAYARHSITPEALAAGKQAFLDITAAIAERNRLKALAEKATEEKDKLYYQLLSWWSDFKKVVNIALKHNPQLKEQVNIVARSK